MVLLIYSFIKLTLPFSKSFNEISDIFLIFDNLIILRADSLYSIDYIKTFYLKFIQATIFPLP